MSSQGPLPFLEFCGTEVCNSARTIEYLRNGLAQGSQGKWILGSGQMCSVLYRTAPGSSRTFISPASDPAPWYDTDEPGATSFLGAIMLGIKGYDGTATRAVTGRIVGLGGGTFGGQHRLPRVWQFRAAMISADDSGAEYGLRWLTSVLEASACAECDTCDLSVRLVCPPDDASNDDLGLWTSYEVALTQGPYEVTQFIDQDFDTDNLAGCRDIVIVEWQMTAGNPFLYKPAVSLGSVTTERFGTCFAVAPLVVFGDPVTDLMREVGEQGDGLAVPAGYGMWWGSTNFHLNGSAEVAFSGTDWLTANGTLTRTTSQALFGRYSGLFTAPGAVANEGFTLRADLAAADQYTGSLAQFSVWLKGAVGGEQLSITASIHHTDTTTKTGTPSNITLTNEWARYSVSLTPTVAKTADRLLLFVGTRVGATTAFSCYADGVQFEKQGTIPTPYLNTEGATATREKSYVQAPGGPDLLDVDVGWVAFRVRMGWPSSTAWSTGDVFLWDWVASTNQRMSLYYDVTNHQWKFDRHDFGGQIVAVADSFEEGYERIIIATWDSGNVKLSIGGAPFTSAVAATSPIIDSARLPYLGASSDGGLPPAVGGFFCGNIDWYGCSSAKTLTDADAAEIASRAPFDPAPQVFSFDIGLPDLKTMTWSADDLTVDTAVANGICDWLFGPPRQILCEEVVPPARGVLGAIFTVTSDNGFGGVVFQAWPDCLDFNGDASLEIGISEVPAGSTVTVDSSRHLVTITDQYGNVEDGQHLLELSDNRGLEWIEVADCDTIGCVCVAVQPCAVGTVTVTIDTQNREG